MEKEDVADRRLVDRDTWGNCMRYGVLYKIKVVLLIESVL